MKVKKCPFCGEQPEVTPYPNGKGYAVRCNTESCALWPYTFDLEEWNVRPRSKAKETVLVYSAAKDDYIRIPKDS